MVHGPGNLTMLNTTTYYPAEKTAALTRPASSASKAQSGHKPDNPAPQPIHHSRHRGVMAPLFNRKSCQDVHRCPAKRPGDSSGSDTSIGLMA